MQPNTDSDSHPNEGWAFHVESDPVPLNQQYEDSPTKHSQKTEPITWTGSEFIAQQKNAVWYLLLAVFIVVVCGVIYFISKDVLSVVFIAVMGVLFAIIAGRKPRQLQYQIDNHGLQVGQRSYSFNDFKSFSLQRDGAIGYVNLFPLKRLRNELSIYYAPEDEQRIFEALAQHIPNEQRVESMVDRLTKKIRF